MLSLSFKSRPDYIVRYIPTAVEVAGQVHSSLAILYDYPGHVGRHGAGRGRRQRLFYAAKCCQVAQLVNSGKDKWEFATFIALQRLGMRHLDQRAFALVERLPVRIKAVHVLLVEGKHDSQCIGQQHTGLLEEFAYGCGPQSRPQRSESFEIGCQWRYRRTDAFRLLRAAII